MKFADSTLADKLRHKAPFAMPSKMYEFVDLTEANIWQADVCRTLDRPAPFGPGASGKCISFSPARRKHSAMHKAIDCQPFGPY